MKGDILIINENHRKAAGEVVDIILNEIINTSGRYVISVAGESGAGKSEIAASIAEKLEENGVRGYIFAQDDYFVYPPKTNAETRVKDINWVGPGEVKLALLDEGIGEVLSGNNRITKPLVIFDEDRIDSETVDLEPYKVLIAEGTYTTLLNKVNRKVFIDRNYHDTKASRQERNRENQDEFLEKILKIEHEEISSHKYLADIIIKKDYTAIKGKRYG